MRWRFACVILLFLAPSVAYPQFSSKHSPKETVERLWISASAGELLTHAGWINASGLFAKPLPPPKTTFQVVANLWGAWRMPIWEGRRVTGNNAVIMVDTWRYGTIDSSLRFVPAPRTDAVKEGETYHVVFAPLHYRRYVNGKLVQEKTTSQQVAWQISDSMNMPFTTVNSAIRYVLEKRNETKSPVLRKNADATLAKLLKLP